MSVLEATPAHTRVLSRTGTRRVSRLHRAKLLAGAVSAAADLGYWHMTVSEIVMRSGVSRGTFYALFADRDECLCAAVEDLLGMVEERLAGLGLNALPWEERMAVGLAETLHLLDSEPVLARACIVEAARGGPRLTEVHERVVERLCELIDQGRLGVEFRGCASRRTSELLAGTVFRAVHARLAEGEEPLAALTGELMSIVVLPYRGERAAQLERERDHPRPRTQPKPEARSRRRRDLAGELPELPKIRLTYRTTRVLECIADHPGSTNRTIALHAGGVDQGQMSKLLRRLERHGLIANDGESQYKWSTNTWSLTLRGEAFMAGIGDLSRFGKRRVR